MFTLLTGATAAAATTPHLPPGTWVRVFAYLVPVQQAQDGGGPTLGPGPRDRPLTTLAATCTGFRRLLMGGPLPGSMDSTTMAPTTAPHPLLGARLLVERYGPGAALFPLTYLASPHALTFDIVSHLLDTLHVPLPKLLVERAYWDDKAGISPLPVGVLERWIAHGYRVYRGLSDELILGMDGRGSAGSTTTTTTAADADTDAESIVTINAEEGAEEPVPTGTPKPRRGSMGKDKRASVVKGPDTIILEQLDDQVRFEDALRTGNMSELRFLHAHHHFVPCLLHLTSYNRTEWAGVWRGLVDLFDADPDLALRLMRDSGVSRTELTQHLWEHAPSAAHFVAMCTRERAVVEASERWVLSCLAGNHIPLSGLRAGAGAGVPGCSGAGSSKAGKDDEHLLDILPRLLPPPQWEALLAQVLEQGFCDSSNLALARCDELLVGLGVPEALVAGALLAPSQPLPAATGPARVPTLRTKAGCTGRLSQFILTRYGPVHPLTQACLHDLVFCARPAALPEVWASVDVFLDLGSEPDPSILPCMLEHLLAPELHGKRAEGSIAPLFFQLLDALRPRAGTAPEWHRAILALLQHPLLIDRVAGAQAGEGAHKELPAGGKASPLLSVGRGLLSRLSQRLADVGLDTRAAQSHAQRQQEQERITRFLEAVHALHARVVEAMPPPAAAGSLRKSAFSLLSPPSLLGVGVSGDMVEETRAPGAPVDVD